MKTSIRAEVPKHAFIWFILLLAFFPIYLMLTISFKTNSQFMANPWFPVAPFHLENWVVGWGIVKHYIFNTIFVAITAVSSSAPTIVTGVPILAIEYNSSISVLASATQPSVQLTPLPPPP